MTGSRGRHLSCSMRGAPVLRSVLALAVAGAPALNAATESGHDPGESVMAPLAGRSLLLDLTNAGDTVIAVGERGHVLLGDRNGRWRQSPVPTRHLLTAVHFQGPDNGWAVGHDAVILRTTDGGLSWTVVHWVPELESPLLDVWFEDGQHGYAVGAYSLFLETRDGGATWETKPFEPAAAGTGNTVDPAEDVYDDDFSDVYDFHLNRLVPGPDRTLYIAAEGGNLYASSDGGANWRELNSPYHGSFFGLLPLRDGTLLAFGLRGHLYRSSDRGETWHRIETGVTEMLTDGLQLEDGGIVIVGLGGTVLRSRDGGRSFELSRLADRHGLSAVAAAADGRLMAVGEGGIVELAPPAGR